MAYILMFAISLFLLWLSLKIKNKAIRVVLTLMSLLLPCVMAALRGLSVGTDTKGYVLSLYQDARNANSYQELVSFSKAVYYSVDHAYLFINYLVAKCGFSFPTLLFVIQCLIVLPIFYAIKLNTKNSKGLIIGMLLFYLTFYNLSLNMVRQSIAIAFVLLGFSLFMNRKEKWSKVLSILLLLIGFGFHDTAIIALPLLVLYCLFVTKKINQKTKQAIFIILSVFAILATVFYSPILNFIGSSGIYPKAIMYMNRFAIMDINYLGVVRNAIILFTVFAMRKNISEKDGNAYFPMFLALINLMFGILSSFIMYIDRIAYYALFIDLLLYVPYIMTKRKKADWFSLALILFFILQWVIVILINNSNGTLPYVFYK